MPALLFANTVGKPVLAVVLLAVADTVVGSERVTLADGVGDALTGPTETVGLVVAFALLFGAPDEATGPKENVVVLFALLMGAPDEAAGATPCQTPRHTPIHPGAGVSIPVTV